MVGLERGKREARANKVYTETEISKRREREWREIMEREALG